MPGCGETKVLRAQIRELKRQRLGSDHLNFTLLDRYNASREEVKELRAMVKSLQSKSSTYQRERSRAKILKTADKDVHAVVCSRLVDAENEAMRIQADLDKCEEERKLLCRELVSMRNVADKNEIIHSNLLATYDAKCAEVVSLQSTLEKEEEQRKELQRLVIALREKDRQHQITIGALEKALASAHTRLGAMHNTNRSSSTAATNSHHEPRPHSSRTGNEGDGHDRDGTDQQRKHRLPDQSEQHLASNTATDAPTSASARSKEARQLITELQQRVLRLENEKETLIKDRETMLHDVDSTISALHASKNALAQRCVQLQEQLELVGAMDLVESTQVRGGKKSSSARKTPQSMPATRLPSSRKKTKRNHNRASTIATGLTKQLTSHRNSSDGRKHAAPEIHENKGAGTMRDESNDDGDDDDGNDDGNHGEAMSPNALIQSAREKAALLRLEIDETPIPESPLPPRTVSDVRTHEAVPIVASPVRPTGEGSRSASTAWDTGDLGAPSPRPATADSDAFSLRHIHRYDLAAEERELERLEALVRQELDPSSPTPTPTQRTGDVGSSARDEERGKLSPAQSQLRAAIDTTREALEEASSSSSRASSIVHGHAFASPRRKRPHTHPQPSSLPFSSPHASSQSSSTSSSATPLSVSRPRSPARRTAPSGHQQPQPHQQQQTYTVGFVVDSHQRAFPQSLAFPLGQSSHATKGHAIPPASSKRKEKAAHGLQSAHDSGFFGRPCKADADASSPALNSADSLHGLLSGLLGQCSDLRHRTHGHEATSRVTIERSEMAELPLRRNGQETGDKELERALFPSCRLHLPEHTPQSNSALFRSDVTWFSAPSPPSPRIPPTWSSLSLPSSQETSGRSSAPAEARPSTLRSPASREPHGQVGPSEHTVELGSSADRLRCLHRERAEAAVELKMMEYRTRAKEKEEQRLMQKAPQGQDKQCVLKPEEEEEDSLQPKYVASLLTPLQM